VNFLCHARHQQTPYSTLGCLLPDLMSFFREVRLRPSKLPADASSPRQRELLQGVHQHYVDDGWFHSTDAFVELNKELGDLLRAGQPVVEGQRFRAHFLGHILLEMLLDAAWETVTPGATQRMYDHLQAVLDDDIEDEVHRFLASCGIEARPPVAMAMQRFVEEAFVHEYDRDERVHFRLGQVANRVRQPDLHEDLIPVISQARERVFARREALWTPPSAATGRI